MEHLYAYEHVRIILSLYALFNIITLHIYMIEEKNCIIKNMNIYF